MDHVGIRNEKLFCFNCGQSKAIMYPLPITDLIQIQKEFTDLHKDCEQTWEEPMPDMSLPLESRAGWWLVNGETGLSSKAMVGTFLDFLTPISTNHYPHDPDDFKRCYKLLKVIPDYSKMLERNSEQEYLDRTYPGLPRYIQSEMFYRHFTVPKGFVFDKKHLLTSCRRVVYPGSVVTLICPNEIKRDNYVTHNDLFVLFLFRHNLPYSQYKPSAFARDIISMEEAGTPYEITF